MFPLDIHKLKELFAYNPEEPLIFNSGLFLFLFTAFLWVYISLSKTHKPKLIFVTIFSLYFYYKSSGAYFVLLIFATVIDFTLAKLIHASREQWKRKFYIVLTLVVNLGMLAYFKYTNFLLDSFFSMTGKDFQPLDIFL